AAIAAVRRGSSHARIVYAGFSQGVAMAFRAAVLGRWPSSGVVAVGGDVPPELLADRALRFPGVFPARGTKDEWYTQSRFEADAAELEARTKSLVPLAFDGGHEWTAAVSE